MKKLKNGKWATDIATPQDVAEFMKEARAMIAKYEWQDRTVTPWGHKENVCKTIETMDGFENCTFSSKQLLIGLANGLVDIMNAWEKQELNGIAVVNPKTQKTHKVDPEMLDLYLEHGYIKV